MTIILIRLLFFAVVIPLICILIHMPHRRLNEKQKEQILKNGFYHFTSNEKANKILNDKYLEGKKLSFECWLGHLIWAYENTTEEKMEKDHERLIKKAKGAAGYSVCLKITISDKCLLDKARIRKSDNAIIFKTNKLDANNIMEVKRWDC